jgi:hypothetical protein
MGFEWTKSVVRLGIQVIVEQVMQGRWSGSKAGP